MQRVWHKEDSEEAVVLWQCRISLFVLTGRRQNVYVVSKLIYEEGEDLRGSAKMGT